MEKRFVFHTDPGHGWMEVSRSEVALLDIFDKVSEYSYFKGDAVYLEEDCDAPLFIHAYEKVFGCKPQFEERHTDQWHWIRNLNRWAP